ncbi:MAG: hypothetical protein ACI4F9_10345 [Lachnospiraceae bacterium]
MSGNFAFYNKENIGNIDAENDNYTNILEYLNNPANFCSFSKGLTKLIQQYGYQGLEDDIDAKTNYILLKLSEINVSIAKSTIRDWFNDKRRPAFASNSRTIMFQICFSLQTSFSDLKQFFHHVYFDRNFNCHTIEEAVYYYCFKHEFPYAHALKLISIIDTYPVENHSDSSPNVFTDEIKDRIDHCSSDDELLNFFKENKDIFYQWNKSALKYIKEYISLIRGKKTDKTVIEDYRAGINILPEDIENCSLVIQEYLLSKRIDGRLDSIAYKQIDSIDFMLDQILHTNTGISKESSISYILRINFPSKKTFSNILNKSDTSTSYDSIRKCLILLKFYHFWVSLSLNPNLIDIDNDIYNIYDIYLEETNSLLTSCGYEELYLGNPYDCLFLQASKTKSPLSILRNIIDSIEYA